MIGHVLLRPALYKRLAEREKGHVDGRDAPLLSLCTSHVNRWITADQKRMGRLAATDIIGSSMLAESMENRRETLQGHVPFSARRVGRIPTVYEGRAGGEMKRRTKRARFFSPTEYLYF